MDKTLRRFLILGAAVGAVIGIAVPGMMDSLFGSALKHTWRDTIAADLRLFFSLDVPRESFVVTIVFGVILMTMALFGSLLGMLVAFALYRFINFLAGEDKP